MLSDASPAGYTGALNATFRWNGVQDSNPDAVVWCATVQRFALAGLTRLRMKVQLLLL